MQPREAVVSVPLFIVRRTTRPCRWPRLRAALGSCAITSCGVFFFFFWGCWEYVYVMLTFICSCLYLILRNTNSWFKIKNTIKIYCETSSSLFTITPVPTPLPVNHEKRFLCIYFYSLPFLLFLHKNNPALPPLPLPQHCFLLISPCLFTESFYDGSVCHIIWLMMTWKEGWCLEAISAKLFLCLIWISRYVTTVPCVNVDSSI